MQRIWIIPENHAKMKMKENYEKENRAPMPNETEEGRT